MVETVFDAVEVHGAESADELHVIFNGGDFGSLVCRG